MPRIPLSHLLAVFAWTGLTTLGGGRSAYVHDAVVARRKWVRNDEFLQDLALSQILPGPNFSNLAVALGFRLRGVPGAAAALLAIVVPGAVVLTALAIVYASGALEGAARLMRGMGAAVVGLVLVTTARLMRGGLHERRGVLVAVVVFLMVGPLRVHAVLAIAAGTALGLWLDGRARRSAMSAPAEGA